MRSISKHNYKRDGTQVDALKHHITLMYIQISVLSCTHKIDFIILAVSTINIWYSQYLLFSQKGCFICTPCSLHFFFEHLDFKTSLHWVHWREPLAKQTGSLHTQLFSQSRNDLSDSSFFVFLSAFTALFLSSSSCNSSIRSKIFFPSILPWTWVTRVIFFFILCIFGTFTIPRSSGDTGSSACFRLISNWASYNFL